MKLQKELCENLVYFQRYRNLKRRRFHGSSGHVKVIATALKIRRSQFQFSALQFDCTALIMYTHDLYANSRAMCMLRRTTREVNFSPPWYYYTHTITAFKVHELSVSCAAENNNNTVQIKVTTHWTCGDETVHIIIQRNVLCMCMV